MARIFSRVLFFSEAFAEDVDALHPLKIKQCGFYDKRQSTLAGENKLGIARKYASVAPIFSRVNSSSRLVSVVRKGAHKILWQI